MIFNNNSEFIYENSNFNFSKSNIFLRTIGGSCAEQIIIKGSMFFNEKEIAKHTYRSIDLCSLLVVNNSIEIDYLDNTTPYQLNSYFYPYIFAMGDILYNLCHTGEFESKNDLLELYIDISYKDINGYSYHNYYLIKPHLTQMNFKVKLCEYGLILKRINKREYGKLQKNK